jgi:hypothetical protein
VTDFLWWPEDFRRTIWSPRRQLVVQHVSVISTSVCPVHQKRESQLKFAAEEIVLLHLMQELQPRLQQTHQQLIQVWRLQENQLHQWRKGWRWRRGLWGWSRFSGLHLFHRPGPSTFLVTPGVFCVLFAILATEKSGMPNAQIAIGLKEKNSRSREKEI